MYLGLVLGVILFGMFLLLLTIGYQTTEEERRGEDEQRMLEPLRTLEPKFFGPGSARSGPSGRAGPWREAPAVLSHAAVDALVDDVERFLRLEQLLAERFVDQPSVRNLHRRTHRACWNRGFEDPMATSEVSADALVDDIERFLRREQFLAELFLVHPSVGNLHRGTPGACSTN